MDGDPCCKSRSLASLACWCFDSGRVKEGMEAVAWLGGEGVRARAARAEAADGDEERGVDWTRLINCAARREAERR